MRRWILAIDVGGTKIAVSLGTKAGKILSKRVFSSQNGRNIRNSLGEIQSSALELLLQAKLSRKELLGLGVAVPGVMDRERRFINKSPHLPAWEKFPLKRFLTRRFEIPVMIENDANAAALGERYFGSGRGIDDFLYLTISTGIGSGIIANGRLVRGSSGTAGEAGHMTVVKNGLPCECGKRGCLEAYSSGTAVANHVRRALRKGASSQYFRGVKQNEITGELVSRAASSGDPLAIQARRLAADALGLSLANLISLLNPKRIILGGGVIENVEHFWAPMMTTLKRESWPSAFRSCEIVRSRLGRRVGDVGALALVLDALNRRP